MQYDIKRKLRNCKNHLHNFRNRGGDRGDRERERGGGGERVERKRESGKERINHMDY